MMTKIILMHRTQMLKTIIPSEWVFSEKSDIRWRRKSPTLQNTPIGEDQYSVQPSECDMTPIEYFSEYISHACLENMVEKTNMYALQHGKTFTPTNVTEIKAFLGLHIIMGCLKYPRVRMYWDSALHLDPFVESMSRERFFQLRSNFHVIDNFARPENCKDKFYKVRPIYDCIRRRCLELQTEEELCVDEQMIPFKGHLGVKQYCKGKPKPWGIKLFLLCGRSGLCYDFLLYQGDTPEISNKFVRKFGLGASIVLKLVERINREHAYLYFDNFFTTFNLLEILKIKYIYAAGTARLCRMPNVPFTSDKDLKKKGRGFSEEVVSMNEALIMCKWFDNRPVVLASNFVGCGSQDEVQRWEKSRKTYVSVSQPEVVRCYNHAMGGVDKIDMLISMYRIFIKPRKWTLRMLFHAVDLACVNSWLEYKRNTESLGEKETMDLLHFKMRIGEALVKMGTSTKVKRGRPSSDLQDIKAKRARTEIRPAPEIRNDLTGHFPGYHDNTEASRCKMPSCKNKTHVFCEKCNVHLCFVKGRNCFKMFHNAGCNNR
ncbi:piggyBac transposable element-derived protein 3-like isoform X1 [Schistocerca serialis cubense]|uniref:piggyBac transposable element-derived protein 3-like isoform X1 n=1 Tax=Schistocerca serialis cubense TaxID=2023355 RepID=UPI00214F5FE0|nr:piggyBac transposable element-derived protein 3-like isoform X1 [Schistocerca serialis cubense]